MDLEEHCVFVSIDVEEMEDPIMQEGESRFGAEVETELEREAENENGEALVTWEFREQMQDDGNVECHRMN